ncbi:MAG: hypothetical protein H6924_05110 [Alphaproteobacteria bacterium]|nr:hypothetical protein [Alphaproteobacteria bacterium]
MSVIDTIRPPSGGTEKRLPAALVAAFLLQTAGASQFALSPNCCANDGMDGDLQSVISNHLNKSCRIAFCMRSMEKGAFITFLPFATGA